MFEKSVRISLALQTLLSQFGPLIEDVVLSAASWCLSAVLMFVRECFAPLLSCTQTLAHVYAAQCSHEVAALFSSKTCFEDHHSGSVIWLSKYGTSPDVSMCMCCTCSTAIQVQKSWLCIARLRALGDADRHNNVVSISGSSILHCKLPASKNTLRYRTALAVSMQYGVLCVRIHLEHCKYT